MSNQKVKAKIRRALRQGMFSSPEDKVTLSDGVNGNIHVRVVSRRFSGRKFREKHDLLWSELEKNLTWEECGLITLAMALSPDERYPI